jgi:hypothetical protein
MAAEMRLALAPRVTFSQDVARAGYSEDNVNFYGTHVYLLEDSMLRRRAEEQLGHPAPPDLKVTAERIPSTSIILVRASSTDDTAATAFLSALVDQFFKFKSEQRKRAFSEEIARMTVAMKSAPQDVLPEIEKARKQVIAASILDTAPVFERVPAN